MTLNNPQWLICHKTKPNWWCNPSTCAFDLHWSLCYIAVIHIQLYTYTCGSKINNNDERTHFFGKIYLTLYSKGLRKGYVWEVSWRLKRLTPNSSVFCSTSFLFCCAAQSEVLREASGRQICTQFNLSTVKVIPWYLRPDVPVIYTGASLWQLGQGSICNVGMTIVQILRCFLRSMNILNENIYYMALRDYVWMCRNRRSESHDYESPRK